MSDLILQYYVWLSSLFNLLARPISTMADQINLPLLSALLFGLLGTTAPCQLSTNVAALAFISREAGQTRKVWVRTLAFIAGKVTVYTLIGGLIVVLSLQIDQIGQTAIPVIMVARRALGPLLVIIGLLMLGLFNFHLSIGYRLSAWIEERIGQREGVLPAFLLGVAFAFTFCPTLFALFFGLTIPLAIATPGGVVFPGVFALGTALPILVFGALLATESERTGALMRRVRAANRWVQRATGAVFILIGLHEIVLYWLI